MDNYITTEEIEDFMSELESLYPNLCQRLALPFPTYEGRTVYYLKIGTPGNKSTATLITGGQHAREWGTSDCCLYFAADFIEAYATKSNLQYGSKTFHWMDIQHTLNSIDIFVLPCVNPDGRYFSLEDKTVPDLVAHNWRRNRNPKYGPLNPDGCIGADTNRNFDWLWDYESKFAPSVVDASEEYILFPPASTNHCADTFHGDAPASEYETQNVVYLMDKHSNIRWLVDVHMYGEHILHPWGDAPNQTTDPDMNFMANNASFDQNRGLLGEGGYKEYINPGDLNALKSVANSMNNAIGKANGNSYVIDQGYALDPWNGGKSKYPTSGDIEDYAYSRHLVDPTKTKIYPFTIEVGPTSEGFQPDWPIMKDIIIETDCALVQFCLRAAPHQKMPKLPMKVAEILFGVMNDGGGIVIIGGKPVPIPPWDPLMRALLQAGALYHIGEELGDARGVDVKINALRSIENAARNARLELEQSLEKK